MTINILAVDDSRTIRELVKMTFAEAGFHTKIAEDGVHGLEVLKDFQPDVILTDINMPRLDGFGFIDEVRNQAKFSKTPILVLTTENADELKSKARQAGATGWIVKPFDGAKLVRAVELVSG